ncbi:hypothetical protein [Vibrio vulnificus]|uniref:hypothetical protein n=1 Tax=Vibrio vulnificus TaxID=672 RepID=UPI00156026D0|nr:hypothetical protein [Vibrio vulnificus]
MTVNGSGSNTLEGGEGDDLLKVNRSVDAYYQRDHVRKAVNTFNGGQGNDRLEGSAGAETYVFNRGTGRTPSTTMTITIGAPWTVGIKSTGLSWVKGLAETS